MRKKPSTYCLYFLKSPSLSMRRVVPSLIYCKSSDSRSNFCEFRFVMTRSWKEENTSRNTSYSLALKFLQTLFLLYPELLRTLRIVGIMVSLSHWKLSLKRHFLFHYLEGSVTGWLFSGTTRHAILRVTLWGFFNHVYSASHEFLW